MSDEHPTNEFPAYGAPGAPGAQPPAPRPDGPGPGGFPPAPTGGGPSGDGPRRSSRRLTVILVAAIVVVLGAGIGVAVAVGTDDSATPAGAPSSTTAGSPGAGNQQGKDGKNAKQGKHSVVRGTITAQSGSTWTVKTLQGKSVKVTIGSDTKYGTKPDPAKAADFTVGKKIVVAGQPSGTSGDTVTARRIRTLPDNGGKKKSGGTKSGSSPAPSSSPS